MCGIFGFVAKETGPMNMKVLARVARVTERRGKHAWGMAWVDSKGRLKMFKQTGRITDSFGILAMAADAQMLIGHCRYATNGDPSNNLNNHPHPVDGGWLVHNGMIHHYERLIHEHDLHPVTDCDSEVLGLLYEQQEGPTLDRCMKVLNLAKGVSPLSMLALWRDQMVVARVNGQPLSIGETSRGYYVASLADGLPGNVKEIPSDTACIFGDDGKK